MQRIDQEVDASPQHNLSATKTTDRKEKKVAATITPSEARKRDPDFFERRPKDANWTLYVETPGGETKEFVGVNWEARSRFGKVEQTVVVDQAGHPLFDRPAYHESPGVLIVAWGRDAKTAEIKISIISEERPHALHPEHPESTVPLKFAQVPMGFVERLLGKEGLQQLELKKTAAMRELKEETGASAIRGFSRPSCPYLNHNPSLMATWSDLFFVEVDLEKVGRIKQDATEAIFKSEFVPVRELFARVRRGQDEDGAILRGGISLAALLIFFACYPEFLPS